MIAVAGLDYAYGTSGTQALARVDLRVEPGAFVLLAGPSGAGKSTLLRAIRGLVPHYHGGRMDGRVLVDGRDTREAEVEDLARDVGIVLQDPEDQVVTHRVLDEVAFGLENLGVDPEEGRRMAAEALASVGIAHLRDRDPSTLSGGEVQRLAVATALAPGPDVLLLDEPTANLDPEGARDLLGTVDRLRDDLGLTVVVAEHRLDLVAPLADRLVALSDGRVVADGPPAEVLTDPVADKLGLRRPPVLDLARRLDRDAAPLTVAQARRALADAPRPDPPAARSIAEDPLARVEDVHFAYDDPVLRGVDLTIHREEVVGLVGPTGAGKSTLARHLQGEVAPDRGRVLVHGRDTRDHGVEELADVVGVVPSEPGRVLFADTVREELDVSLADRDVYGAEAWIDELLAMLDLAHLEDRHPRDLSGGERQRLALAAFAVRNPDLLVLDEPTRGLDPRRSRGLARLVRWRRDRGRATLLITHDADLVARTCDRVAFLAAGRISGPHEVHAGLGRSRIHTTQISLLARAVGADGRTLTVDEWTEGLP